MKVTFLCSKTPEILFKEFTEASIVKIEDLEPNAKFFIRKGLKENCFRLIDLADFLYNQDNPGLGLGWEAYCEFSEFDKEGNPWEFHMVTATSQYEYMLKPYECTYTGAYRGLLSQLQLPNFGALLTGDELVSSTMSNDFKDHRCTLKMYVDFQSELYKLKQRKSYFHSGGIETPRIIMAQMNTYGWAD